MVDSAAAPRRGSAVPVARPAARVLTGRLDEDPTYRRVRLGGTTDWLILVTLAGRGRIRSRGRADVLTGPAELTAVEPYVLHDYGTDPAAGRWSLCWAHLDPRQDWLPLLDWPTVAPGIRQLRVEQSVRDRIVQSLDRATAAARRPLAHGERFAMNAVEEALLWCDTQNPSRPVLDSRLLAVVDHVNDHLDQPHTVQSLARIGGLSPSRLAHLARAQLGISLMAQVERQRMDLARQLLTMTDLPVATIGARSGFTDPLYFSRRFRRVVGEAPTAYRSGR